MKINEQLNKDLTASEENMEVLRSDMQQQVNRLEQELRRYKADLMSYRTENARLATQVRSGGYINLNY